jgi:hypothetical protein
VAALEPRDAALPAVPAIAPVDAAPAAASGAPPDAAVTASASAPLTRPSPASPAPARPSGPPGFITIDSAPVYATIRIDGKSYGETPLVNIALAPGRHRVHAVAPSGATRDVYVTIESGKVALPNRIEW